MTESPDLNINTLRHVNLIPLTPNHGGIDQSLHSFEIDNTQSKKPSAVNLVQPKDSSKRPSNRELKLNIRDINEDNPMTDGGFLAQVQYLHAHEKSDLLPRPISDLDLVWNEINIVAKAEVKDPLTGKSKKIDKIILNNINGRVRAGECLAILGSTGAGKTTLLNHLSRKIESKTLKITGHVLLNGKNISTDKFDTITSYVMQDDILEPVMTPLEILMFTAKLKLNLTLKEIENKVYQMIDDLHLTKCKDTRVGNNLVRGVSEEKEKELQ